MSASWLLALGLALVFSCAAAFETRADPAVTDGNTAFHRIYVVGSGDSAQENTALSDDLNELRAALEQGQNHKSLNSTSLIRPPLFFLQAVFDGVKISAQPGDAVTIYFSGRGNENTFRLGSGVDISADELAALLAGFAPGVERTVIMDSCFGGSFVDELESTEVAVIGTSTTCPFNAPFDDFIDTFSEDIAELAGVAGGNLTAAELEAGLIGLNWKLGQAMSDVIENGQSKCDGDCDLPAIIVDPPECGVSINVAGTGFRAINSILIEVLDSEEMLRDSTTTTTNSAGAFNAVSVDVDTAPTLVVTKDGEREGIVLQDWHFCEAGGGVVPDNTAPSCDLVAGIGVIDVTLQDLESGLSEVEVRRASNVSVSVPSFDEGTTDPLEFQATILNSRRTARLRLRVTDVAGNTISCSKTVRRS